MSEKFHIGQRVRIKKNAYDGSKKHKSVWDKTGEIVDIHNGYWLVFIVHEDGHDSTEYLNDDEIEPAED